MRFREKNFVDPKTSSHMSNKITEYEFKSKKGLENPGPRTLVVPFSFSFRDFAVNLSTSWQLRRKVFSVTGQSLHVTKNKISKEKTSSETSALPRSLVLDLAIFFRDSTLTLL